MPAACSAGLTPAGAAGILACVILAGVRASPVRSITGMSEATVPVLMRNPCPPGACQCERDRLLADPASDKRVLALTKEEEKRLLARLEAVSTLPELKRMMERMRQLLGIELQIAPGANEVRST